MLVGVYQIARPDASRDQEIADILGNIQLIFKRAPGCSAQSLLRDLKDPQSFIVAGYCRDRERQASASALQVATDKALDKFRVKPASSAFDHSRVVTG